MQDLQDHLKSINIFCIDADLTIDAAHDMGVLSADFCKLYHTDRMYSSQPVYNLEQTNIHFWLFSFHLLYGIFLFIYM